MLCVNIVKLAKLVILPKLVNLSKRVDLAKLENKSKLVNMVIIAVTQDILHCKYHDL